MDIITALNELEDLVENSGKVPLTHKLIIDEDRLLDLVDHIRTSLPEEVRQAKWIIQEREKVLNDAQQEAVRTMETAQKHMEQKADDSEITRQAKKMAEDIVQKADYVAQEIRIGARDYAEDILANLAKDLDAVFRQIEKSREELRKYS